MFLLRKWTAKSPFFSQKSYQIGSYRTYTGRYESEVCILPQRLEVFSNVWHVFRHLQNRYSVSSLSNIIVRFSAHLGNFLQFQHTQQAAVSNTRPANLRKNEDFKRIIGPSSLFSQKHWILTLKCFLQFLMWPARPCFQFHATRETL